MTTELLGAFQRPVLNQDATVVAIAGGATLTLVNTVAPADGTLIASLSADVSVTGLLTGGAATSGDTGTSQVLSVAVRAGQTVTLTAAASGPCFRVSGSVALVTTALITMADIAQLFTAAGQLLVGTGPSAAEILNPGVPGETLTVGGPDPSGLGWVPGASAAVVRVAQFVVNPLIPVPITFLGIPGTYSALELVLVGSVNGSGSNPAEITLQINNDAGADYDSETIQNTTAALVAGSESLAATSMSVGALPGAIGTPAGVGAIKIVIGNYAATGQKAILADCHYVLGTSTGQIVRRTTGGQWRLTAPVSRLALSATTGQFAVGTIATLYGFP